MIREGRKLNVILTVSLNRNIKKRYKKETLYLRSVCGCCCWKRRRKEERQTFDL